MLTTEFNWTKVRHIMNCSNCSAPRCVFSKYAIGNAKGPTKKHMAILEKYVEEHGYLCGDAIRIYSNGGMEAPETEDDDVEELPLLFCKEEQVCWDTVESQYYATEDRIRSNKGRMNPHQNSVLSLLFRWKVGQQ